MSERRATAVVPVLIVILLALLFAVVLIPQLTGTDLGSPTAPEASRAPNSWPAVAPIPTEQGRVTHLVDGDTLDVSLGGVRTRIRLLNVDTPETVKENTPVQCMGPEASARLKQLVPVGSTVGLVFDVERVDQYGRTLATVVTASGQNVSEVLAQEGLGRAVRHGQNVEGYATVQAAVERAREARLGLWSGACG
ncbi:thermonuclease family protein [Lacisediminihabitans sp. FW035]